RRKTNRSFSRQPSADEKNRTNQRRSPMSQSNLNTNDSDNHTTERRVPMTRIRIDDLPVAENLTPEQEALIQGAGLKSFRPSLEGLEDRFMPAAVSLNIPASEIDLTNKTLTITGFESLGSNYNSSVRMNNDGRVVVDRGGQSVELNRSQIDRIVYLGREAAEDFKNLTTIPSEFRNQGSGDTYETPFKLTSPDFLNKGQLPANSATQGPNRPQRIGSAMNPWDPHSGNGTIGDRMVDGGQRLGDVKMGFGQRFDNTVVGGQRLGDVWVGG